MGGLYLGGYIRRGLYSGGLYSAVYGMHLRERSLFLGKPKVGTEKNFLPENVCLYVLILNATCCHKINDACIISHLRKIFSAQILLSRHVASKIVPACNDHLCPKSSSRYQALP